MQTELYFEARNKTLSDVLFAGRKFRIPRYQRPYAWQGEETSEFWEDLNASDEPYFLGSLIFNTEFEKKDGRVDIIDGQQRLLTATILCAVLRDCAAKLDPERADLYQRQDISIQGRDGTHSYIIEPAETITEFFLQHVQQKGSDIVNAKTKSPEERRVKENYTYLHEKVSKELDRHASNESKLATLEKLRTKVANLIVISVEIKREEDAYEIFETTNARGLELSVADLLKNLIFKHIPQGQNRDVAKEAWVEITEEIESTSTELRKFIRYFWISKYDFVPEKRLYRAIKNEINDWQQLLKDLAENSKWYGRMLEGTEQEFQEMKHGAKIYESLFALRLMRVSQCYVLLLSILRNFDRLGTDPLRIIQLIEMFSFKYSVICKQPTNRVEQLYSRTAIEIEEALKLGPPKKIPGEIQAIFSKLEKKLKSMLPSEQLFEKAFGEVSYRSSDEGRQLVKYILGKINAYFSQTKELQIDFNIVNIEHILPRKPHKDWNVKKNDIKGYVNLLGNLTLLSKNLNSRVSNAPLDRKLPELEKSELQITKILVKHLKGLKSPWNEDEIRTRQKELAELAFKYVWA